jgi:hypothetical protein
VKVEKSEGLNESERKLAQLGKNIFLEMWSYPNVYYEKGKELADLLVICDNHVLIFSDKKIIFDVSKDLNLAWERWHKEAILKSIKQLRKAEYRIRNFPDRIFLDAKCSHKFPISVPDVKDIKIHLLCIANGTKEACKKFFGDSTGSLRFSTHPSEHKYMPGGTLFLTTDYDKINHLFTYLTISHSLLSYLN